MPTRESVIRIKMTGKFFFTRAMVYLISSNNGPGCKFIKECRVSDFPRIVGFLFNEGFTKNGNLIQLGWLFEGYFTMDEGGTGPGFF